MMMRWLDRLFIVVFMLTTILMTVLLIVIQNENAAVVARLSQRSDSLQRQVEILDAQLRYR